MKYLKFICLGLAVQALHPAFLRGGVILTMQSDSSYGEQHTKSDMKQYISPKASRLELSLNYQHPEKKGRSTQKSVIITRLDKKVLWMLMPSNNGYCEFTFEELRKAAKSGGNLVPDSAMTSGVKYKKTSGSRKIAGFKTDEYTFSGKDLNGKAWLSNDKKLKEAGEFYAAQAKALGASGAGAAGAPGVLMAYEASSAKSSHKMEVKSVKTEEVGASMFDIPKGYTRMKSAEWKNYQSNFDSKIIMERMKSEFKDSAKKAAKGKAKDAAKKKMKGLLGF